MSKKEFELKKDFLEAMAIEAAKKPNIPVDVSLQESEDIQIWCQPDKPVLIKSGLDWNIVEDLPIRTGACRYIQSEWRKEYQSIEEAQKEWAEKSPAAFKLRNELLHHFNHAFYGRSDLLAKTRKIAEGDSSADMIQDLSVLNVLGKANIKLLETRTIMDISLLDTAAAESESLSVLLASSNGEKLKDNEKKVLRDKAYAHMKEAVDEIRRCGQYVFWKDKQRLKGYRSQYIKMKNKSRKKGKNDSIETGE